MFSREIVDELKNWAAQPDRKPLVLRGARQVGKTVAVDLFATGFDRYIHLTFKNRKIAICFVKNYRFVNWFN